ncbi:MAG: aminopeptidase [Polyangiaceae bacterium]
MLRPLAAAITLTLLPALGGCMQVCYVAQAAYGQDDFAWRARPIDEVVADDATPEGRRQLLAMIADVKRYGETQGIAPTNSYRHFVDLPRDNAVYVVSAAHPLRFESLTWWFPIVGSVPYLGYFNPWEAKLYGERLAEEGWDVDLRGASAYSTLGWFDDPILSTMIRPYDGMVGGLVNVVIHESVHATHYVGGQTYFNESLANYVADELTGPYLTERLALDRYQQMAYRMGKLRGDQRAKRLHETYLKLEALYASDLSDEEKLKQKAAITAALQVELGFSRPINNATLAQARQYHGGSTIFARLHDHCEGDWHRFFAAVKTIEKRDFAEDQQVEIDGALEPLLTRPCPAG